MPTKTRVCEMVVEDGDRAFGLSRCGLDSIGQFLVTGYGLVELCDYHRNEFNGEIPD